MSFRILRRALSMSPAAAGKQQDKRSVGRKLGAKAFELIPSLSASPDLPMIAAVSDR